MSTNYISSCIPDITITINPEKDIDRFVFFLKNKEYKKRRSNILTFYPKLADKIKQGKNEKETVRKIVSDMYHRYDIKIKDIITATKKEFSESEPVFAALSKYMKFPQLKERSYIALPTFLPFCPLNDNTFFFSIASSIAGQEIKPFQIVSIGIHEISHFIFFEQLNEWSKNNKITLNDASTHYFKEALTAAVMNQPEFKKFFNYLLFFRSDNYPGNSELYQLSINYERKKENIITIFEKEILNNSKGYAAGLDYMLHQFKNAGNIFTKKWKLWNSLSDNFKKQEKLIQKYKEPVRFTLPKSKIKKPNYK